MPLSVGVSFLIILVVAITTFATRVIPFLVFPKGKKIPDIIHYLGKVLTPAVIGMLVVYCLKDISFVKYTDWLPELISVFAVVILHVWKRNTLLSIIGGTGCYMLLIRFMC